MNYLLKDVIQGMITRYDEYTVIISVMLMLYKIRVMDTCKLVDFFILNSCNLYWS